MSLAIKPTFQEMEPSLVPLLMWCVLVLLNNMAMGLASRNFLSKYPCIKIYFCKFEKKRFIYIYCCFIPSFCRVGFPLMLITTAVAMVYLLICHVAFTWHWEYKEETPGLKNHWTLRTNEIILWFSSLYLYVCSFIYNQLPDIFLQIYTTHQCYQYYRLW